MYIKARFRGKGCEILLNDEVLYGTSHNFVEIVVDNQAPYRIQTSDVNEVIKIGGDLKDEEHTVTICKDTEAGIGYLEFVGIRCQHLSSLPSKPTRKLEFVGTSPTAGADLDRSVTPCYFGDWYYQHNAYMSYGPVTARNLKAQWHITAMSGIGVARSCCKIPFTMPKIYGSMFLPKDSVRWDYVKYVPDAVIVCLGESDGVMDSVKFCNAYIDFVKDLRADYFKTNIICLSIPTSDKRLSRILQNSTEAIAREMNRRGDAKVFAYHVTKTYVAGCNDHPNMEEHSLIADELTDYLKKLLKWK